MKKRDLQIIYNMTIRLKEKLITAICSNIDCETNCPFNEQICLDADTISSNIESIMENTQ